MDFVRSYFLQNLHFNDYGGILDFFSNCQISITVLNYTVLLIKLIQKPFYF